MSGINWRKAGAYLLVALPVLGLAGIAVLARQQQQDTSQQPAADPLAEAARKAREQKKEVPKAKKVYTNDDVASAPSEPASAPAPAAAEQKEEPKEKPASDANAGAESAEKAKAPAKNTEEDWRKRFKETREKLADAEKELDILQREAQKAQVQYYSDPQKALAEQYTRQDITDKDTKIDAKKKEVEQLKQQLSDMEDELRRTGGDIGWARE
jgi:chromosome segregation ATPase